MAWCVSCSSSAADGWHGASESAPSLQDPGDAIVRPFIAGRCDGDTLPIHRPVSRAMQVGMAVGAIDPVVGCICGAVPFKGPFAIGHECVAQVVSVGAAVEQIQVGQIVVVPWAVSCGHCSQCRRGLTSKCGTTTTRTLAAYGFGPASGPWGGMIADALRVPFADHMLVPVPPGVPALRVAAAGDNLADAWRSVVRPLERAAGSVRPDHRRRGQEHRPVRRRAFGRARRGRRRLPRRRPHAPADCRVLRCSRAGDAGFAPGQAVPSLRRRGGSFISRGWASPRDPLPCARWRLHRGWLLPRHRDTRAAHAHVRHRRHAPRRCFACTRGPA